jgi:hypothetical protein
MKMSDIRMLVDGELDAVSGGVQTTGQAAPSVVAHAQPANAKSPPSPLPSTFPSDEQIVAALIKALSS